MRQIRSFHRQLQVYYVTQLKCMHCRCATSKLDIAFAKPQLTLLPKGIYSIVYALFIIKHAFLLPPLPPTILAIRFAIVLRVYCSSFEAFAIKKK